MSCSPSTVVVVGAGFSGTMTAVHLLRTSAGPLRLMLVDRRGMVARGVAYGTCNEAHLLNVPAAAMSAFPDDPESFLRFARERSPSTAGGAFLPRRLYGEYLGEVLRTTEAATPSSVRLERVLDEVREVAVDRASETLTVQFQRGAPVRADRVVLALGNLPPANPPTRTPEFYASARYVRDPWAPGALTAVVPDDRVLLIGTGLTMVDVVLELEARGVVAPIQVVSRRGLLPQPHRSPAVAPTREHVPPGLDRRPATAVGYLRAVRRHVRNLAARGLDWREVVGALRPITPDLWEALDGRERARFLRHLRAFWEVHRHRAAPAAWGRVEALRAAGRVVVRAGRLWRYDEHAGGVQVTVRPRGGGAEERLTVTKVVNCTGPAGDLEATTDPLITASGAAGLLRADRHGVGIETAADGTVLDRNRVPVPHLYYVGPLMRATFWEATAVPELRSHAARVADALARSLVPGGHAPRI